MAKQTLHELQAENVRRTYLFMAILFCNSLFNWLLFVWYFNWGTVGLVILALIIILYNWFAYENSDKIALASVNARPADPDKYYVLHNVVEEVALAAGIPKPKVYVMDEAQPNAFATGKDPNHASVCVTTGLLSMMDRAELQGVIAHEVAHIRNKDILLMTVIGIVAGLIILARDVMMRGMFWGAGGRRDRENGGNAIFLIVRLDYSLLFAPIFVVSNSTLQFQGKGSSLQSATGCIYYKRS